MPLYTQPYKGARDFYPEDKRRQDYMFTNMRVIAARYGYQEYDAPVIEPLDLYRAKTGDEIVNEQVYSFEDRGGREVAIRPEMTPTVSRMVAARRQELGYPLRWFSIPNLWRYERPQRGRLREHWQLNVDIFGDPGVSAEYEVIALASDLLQSFGAKPEMFQIKISSRKLINWLMANELNLNEDSTQKLAKLIDRMAKIETAAFEAAVTEVCGDKTKKALELLRITDLNKLPNNADGLTEIKQLLTLLQSNGIINAVFDITLMRGFDYYTDIVFEVFDTNPDNNRSMFGGGRYDGLVGLFGVDPVPTVGFGMGDVTLANFLETNNLFPELKTSTNVQLVVVGDEFVGASKLAEQLRQNGINVAMDATDRKIDKKLKGATKNGVTYALFVGADELASGSYSLKNLNTGDESKVNLDQAIATLRS